MTASASTLLVLVHPRTGASVTLHRAGDSFVVPAGAAPVLVYATLQGWLRRGSLLRRGDGAHVLVGELSFTLHGSDARIQLGLVPVSPPPALPPEALAQEGA